MNVIMENMKKIFALSDEGRIYLAKRIDELQKEGKDVDAMLPEIFEEAKTK